MDIQTLIYTLIQYGQHHPVIVCIISAGIGVFFPALMALLFPRRRTVNFGIFIYNSLGLFLLQKRPHYLIVSDNVWSRIGFVIRTTFADLSFGVYIASREDFDKEEKQEKIEEYIAIRKKPHSDDEIG
jgi:hypothetical protein